jgi:hypothetical protein
MLYAASSAMLWGPWKISYACLFCKLLHARFTSQKLNGMIRFIIGIHTRRRYSSLSIATGYGLDDQGIFLSPTTSRSAVCPSQSPIHWIPEALPTEIKRQSREAGRPPPSSAEVNNDEAVPPLPDKPLWRGD